MNKTLSIGLLLFVTASFAHAGEIIKFQLFDGETVEGKLSLPANTPTVKELVIYVHGTGPATYDNHRKFGTIELNYFDYFANEFNRRGIGFFTYSKRGVALGQDPPFFDQVDREKFRKVVPSTEIKDIATFISTLRKDKRLAKTKIVLLGWSEGTVLASMAAEDKRNKVTALFLNGYPNENIYELIKWQNTGGSAMVGFRIAFDKDKNGLVSRAEFESDDKIAAALRTRMQNVKFEQLDVTKDDAITAADFAVIQKPKYDATLDAYNRGDEDWIWKNYFRVSIPWLKEHFALEANKDRLLRLNIPIYIFHGEDDANCPVEGVYDVRSRFEKAKKTNLHANIFPGHNHDLNFVDWVLKKEMPAGIKKMFEVADELNK
jgi:pimeloyl-ACP methyl ester carboxylesterase